MWVVASVWGGSESHPSQFWLSGVGWLVASLVVVLLSVGAHILFGGCGGGGGLVGVCLSVLVSLRTYLSVCLSAYAFDAPCMPSACIRVRE